MARREPCIQSIKGEKISFGRGSPIFLIFERREREGGRERKVPFGDSRDFVGPRTKVHRLNEGYTWVSETKDFAKDSSEDFRKSKVSGLGSVHETS